MADTKTPKKNWRPFKAIIFVALLIGVISAFTRDSGGEDRIETSHPASSYGEHDIWITANQWSPPIINLGITEGKMIAWTPYLRDVGFYVMINDGDPMKNGTNYYTPSIDEAKAQGWVAPVFPNTIRNIRFMLDDDCGYTTAQLAYEITRVP